MTPGSLLGRALGTIGVRDPRALLVVALLASAALAAHLHRARGLLAATAVALSPALVMGVALGAPDAQMLAAVLVTFALVARARIALPVAIGIAVVESGAGAWGATSLGLGGLLAYFGAEGSPIVSRLLSALVLGALWFLPERWPRAFAVAVGWLALLWVWGTSALWLGAPVALLALGAVEQGDDEPAAA
jgi:hypothetical protein